MSVGKTVLVQSSEAVFRVVDGEAVIVEPRNGMVNVLSGVGTRIWELLDGVRDVSDIAGILQDEYEVTREQAESDAREFLEDLKSKGLVHVKN